MSSYDSDSEIPKKKKGVTNIEKYKHVVIKTSKIKGLPHLNHKGKRVAGRQTGVSCRCPLKCFEKMSEDDMDSLIERINSFRTKNEQDIYLQGMIELFVPKDTSKRTEDQTKTKPKTISCKYFVDIGTERKKVCKSAFVSLHGITVKRCRRLAELKKQNKIPQDLRGKAKGSRSNVIPGEYCIKIHEFIDNLD
ncbi:hypothetical protein KGM_209331 [Danaus plexippus plexippus]|uniref:Uncharacterized protein n=1 Tax=Danaus plexippus plexippus TaxID=278856 RepID=A0A212EK75_DANPL|nr:hypothetical protein KGM_209331 [Danaus plexippus plexippus]